MAKQLTIDEEFRDLLPPLTADEKSQLRQQIESDGCTDPVIVWKGTIVDGHHRHEICTTASKPFNYEVVVAPGYEPEALEVLKRKRNLRILSADPGAGSLTYDLRPITGGLLVQTPDTIDEDPSAWQTVTKRIPSQAELADLAFAWKAVKHIKSNAIVFVKDQTLVGMGAGQPNRVVSVHLSGRAAGEKSKGSVLASDAFFPFPDNIELAAEAGVAAIVQPGGSIRDEEVIEAANQSGLAMVFTGVRHFRH